jgi:hypothetical protein
LSVTAKVSITQVVGQNENNIWQSFHFPSLEHDTSTSDVAHKASEFGDDTAHVLVLHVII